MGINCKGSQGQGKLEERGRGRPRLRWINDVEDDLRKLGVKRWRMKAVDREEWASVIWGSQGQTERAVALKEEKEDTGNRSRDLPTSSAVP